MRHLLGVPEQEPLTSMVGERGVHLLRRGESVLYRVERVLQGLGIAPASEGSCDAPPDATPESPRVERPAATKFDLGRTKDPAPAPTPRHIPWGYGENRVTAMPVDPDRLYVYWEVTDAAIETARLGLGNGAGDAWPSLRVYDVTGRIFDGTNAHSYFDHRVERHERQWFFAIGKPGATVCVEVGMKSREGYFVRIARSARTDFPRSAPAPAGAVEWMSVRSATGPVESVHTSPPPSPLHVQPPSRERQEHGRAGGVAAAAAHGRAIGGDVDAGRNGQDAGAIAIDAGGTRFASWREVLPGAWQEVRRTSEWVGGVERTSWEAGPFREPVEAPRFEVIARPLAGGRSEWSDGGTQVIEEPWEVIIRGIDGRVERRVLGRWEVVKLLPLNGMRDAGVTGAPAEDRAPVAIGGSEVARPGASDLRLGASELRLRGASEEFLLGASELRFRGSSERRWGGASEQHWAGASEHMAERSGAWAFAGGSERVHAGASELRLGGASELMRSASVTWNAFAAEGARLAASAGSAGAIAPSSGSAPSGASEHRLGGASEGRLAFPQPSERADTAPTSAPRADAAHAPTPLAGESPPSTAETADPGVAMAPVPPRG